MKISDRPEQLRRIIKESQEKLRKLKWTKVICPYCGSTNVAYMPGLFSTWYECHSCYMNSDGKHRSQFGDD